MQRSVLCALYNNANSTSSEMPTKLNDMRTLVSFFFFLNHFILGQ